MRLTTKGRYAVTAMLDLALQEGKRPVTLQDIAANQEISLSYLEQLFARLRAAGLVKGMRGPGGGYRLARDMDKISIAAVIGAVDETADMTRCGGEANCLDGEKCLTHELWMELSEKIYEFLNAITLGELVRRPEVIAVAERQEAVRKGLLSGKLKTVIVEADAVGQGLK
ncbi:MAG: Rrf2 family transcriptional regulator [Arenicellales bacterium]|jgi:Rrf2 family iron-sulfur cluster assembly transcriptional regulator|nr:Rrf2 family transcriptional regulator [Gammaproteobacteria bacterium]NDA14024.1 Rrf2 family transcriptional regulator [Gammaproteobacteria bacterium]NDG43334.1 Rrf2 family transcriptional regulator [Gammaproteobacteria bacterium]